MNTKGRAYCRARGGDEVLGSGGDLVSHETAHPDQPREQPEFPHKHDSINFDETLNMSGGSGRRKQYHVLPWGRWGADPVCDPENMKLLHGDYGVVCASGEARTTETTGM